VHWILYSDITGWNTEAAPIVSSLPNLLSNFDSSKAEHPKQRTENSIKSCKVFENFKSQLNE